jgi:hypothetical protein
MLLVALLLFIASAPHAGDGLPFQWIGGQHSTLHNTALTGDTNTVRSGTFTWTSRVKALEAEYFRMNAPQKTDIADAGRCSPLVEIWPWLLHSQESSPTKEA